MTRDAHCEVAISVPDGDMPAHVWTPDDGSRRAGLLLLQEIFGISPYIRRRAAALADAGYVVLAPDLYWRLDPGVAPLDASAPDVVGTAMSRAMSLDWETTVADSAYALQHLRESTDVDRAGIVGFCFGGGVGFNVAAVADTDCLVSYYGSAIPQLMGLAAQITAPSLHHFGLADDYIDAAAVERIRDAVTRSDATVQFETYAGANHAFDNDDFYHWNPQASALAWKHTLSFLAESLSAGVGQPS